MKYYAVRKGASPGIYTSWEECRKLVTGFKGAEYKSFPDRESAQKYMAGGTTVDKAGGTTKKPGSGEVDDISNTGNASAAYSFVDGSYNQATGVYGYGGFLVYDGKKYILSGSGDDAEMASMRNVAGEVLGSMAAVEKALELGIESLDIYYDYMGISAWALGEWKRNKKGTIAYHDYIESVSDKIKLNFVKVKGHSGVEGNEEADRLAKKAVGIGD